MVREKTAFVCCLKLSNSADKKGCTNRLIEPFQKGEIDTFVQHIQEGLDCLKKEYVFFFQMSSFFHYFAVVLHPFGPLERGGASCL